MVSFKVYLLVLYGVGAFFRTVSSESLSSSQDMYLTALKHSHLNEADAGAKDGQGYSYPPAPDINYLPSIELSNSYKEPTGPAPEYGTPTGNAVNGNDASVTSYNRHSPNYGAPDATYGAPAPTYGAPPSDYGPPAAYGAPGHNYNAPSPVYGAPPIPAPSYGPAPVYFKPVPYPHYLHDHWPLLAKLKAKLNLFTIGKLLLKLVIFKKIIKFISFICLLLVLPKLKDLFKGNMSNDNYSSESSRTVHSKDSLIEQRLDELYEFALKSLQNQF